MVLTLEIYRRKQLYFLNHRGTPKKEKKIVIEGNIKKTKIVSAITKAYFTLNLSDL